MTLKVFRLNDRAYIPERGSPGAAGLDLRYSGVLPIKMNPGDRRVIETGIAISLTGDVYARIAPRSGLAVKGVDILAGVVDRDYRGELKVILALWPGSNTEPIVINPGDKAAQLIIEKLEMGQVIEVMDKNELGDTIRGLGGFGSTGR